MAIALLSKRQSDFHAKIAKIISYVSEIGKYDIKISSLYRTQEEQKLAFDMKATKTLNSKHLDGLACDFILFDRKTGKIINDSSTYRVIGLIAELEGLVWGGRFGVKKADYGTKIGWDSGHVEAA